MDEDRLNHLLLVWEEEHCNGRDLPAAELCRDCPELAEELRKRIEVLRHMYFLVKGNQAVSQSAESRAENAAGNPGTGTWGTGSVSGGEGETWHPPGGAQAPPVPRPESVPGYEILEELGRGGMGVVYHARQVKLNRPVALKMVLSGAYAGAADVARFTTEAKAVARLLHPHIVQIYEIGEPAGRPFFSLEYVEGGSLDKRTGGAPQPPLWAADLVEKLTRAVHYAHQQGILHRDLKPANVLVAADGTPKITDFGLAKLLDEETGATQSGAVLGTPSYMAPEQAAGRTRALGPAADVYALGAILYELLTGRPPFRGEDALETLHQVCSQEPVPPRRLAPKVPRDLETITLKCLDKEPGRRYGSALALAEDLHRFQTGEPIRARPVGPGRRLFKWVKRRPTAAALWAFGLVALLLAGGFWVWQVRARAWRQAETARSVEKALDRVASLRGQTRAGPADDRAAWSAALAEGRRAEALLEQGEGNDELRQRVRDVLDELEAEERDRRLIERLEELPFPMELLEGQLDFPKTDADIRALFAGYGIDVERLTPGQAADRIRALPSRRVKDRLTAALDGWAGLRSYARPNDPAGWLRLLEIARRADADPLRARLRDALIHKDLPALQALAADSPGARLPASTFFSLGHALASLNDVPGAVKVLRQAQQEFPGDFWINHTLAYLLYQMEPPQPVDAIRFFTAALALRSRSAGVHNNFGKALHKFGKLDEAMTAYRKALDLNPAFAEPHCNLGRAWADKGNSEKALAAYRQALRVQNDYVPAYLGLAKIRIQQGELDKAAALCRRAVKLRPDSYLAHFSYAEILRKQNRLDKAIAEYRQVIRLRKDFAPAHKNLGIALWKKGLLDEAIAAHEKALHYRQGYAEAYNNLGNVLTTKGQLDKAIAAYHKALGLKKNYAEAHCNLGRALQQQGRFAKALAELKRGDALGSKRPDWPYPSQEWIRTCQRFLELDGKLPAIRKGTAQPAGPAERIELAQLCRLKQQYRAAARFYRDAFALEPALADPLPTQNRFHAACVATLAGCGQGTDALPLAAPSSRRWRQQALSWLQADLACWRKQLLEAAALQRQEIHNTLAQWQRAADLGGLRDPAALAGLSESEQKACRQFWAGVDEVLAKCLSRAAIDSGGKRMGESERGRPR
jgi:serine/threonine-protein kinase